MEALTEGTVVPTAAMAVIMAEVTVCRQWTAHVSILMRAFMLRHLIYLTQYVKEMQSGIIFPQLQTTVWEIKWLRLTMQKPQLIWNRQILRTESLFRILNPAPDIMKQGAADILSLREV